MSTDCENLLKKLLVLNPGKRGNLQVRAAAGRLLRLPLQFTSFYVPILEASHVS